MLSQLAGYRRRFSNNYFVFASYDRRAENCAARESQRVVGNVAYHAAVNITVLLFCLFRDRNAISTRSTENSVNSAPSN